MPHDPEELDDEKLAELERFFAPLASVLVAFAERHNLRIEKYHRGQPNWSFIFRLSDQGSLGHLQVLRTGAEEVLIAGHREQRDVERLRRFIALVGQVTVPRDSPHFADALKTMLAAIINLPTSQLKPDGFDHLSRRQEFARACEYFAAQPLAKLDCLGAPFAPSFPAGP
jgi:hypothetical protein